MILPNKMTKTSRSLIYKALIYYRENDRLIPKNNEEIMMITILYMFKYVDIQNKLSIDGETDIEVIKIRGEK